jgi:hypothetical protein
MFNYGRGPKQVQKRKAPKPSVERRRRRRRDLVTGELLPLPDLQSSKHLLSDDEGNEDNAEAENQNENELQTATPVVDPGLTGQENADQTAAPAAGGDQGPGEDESRRIVDDSSMQIIDLHTGNPLISFREKVYVCQWGSALGTDMIFIKHNEAGDGAVLKRLGDFDLLGMTSARLVASRAKLVYQAND